MFSLLLLLLWYISIFIYFPKPRGFLFSWPQEADKILDGKEMQVSFEMAEDGEVRDGGGWDINAVNIWLFHGCIMYHSIYLNTIAVRGNFGFESPLPLHDRNSVPSLATTPIFGWSRPFLKF